MNTESIISEEDIRSMVIASRESIKKQIVEGVIESTKNSIRWELERQVGALVKEVIETTLAEDIKAEIASQRVSILVGLEGIGAAIGAECAKLCIEQMHKNMQSSYNVGRVVEALFK